MSWILSDGEKLGNSECLHYSSLPSLKCRRQHYGQRFSLKISPNIRHQVYIADWIPLYILYILYIFCTKSLSFSDELLRLILRFHGSGLMVVRSSFGPNLWKRHAEWFKLGSGCLLDVRRFASVYMKIF